MSRLFLSGQTTCALLLGAGLLLRAQAALRDAPEPAGAEETRPALDRGVPPARPALDGVPTPRSGRLARPSLDGARAPHVEATRPLRSEGKRLRSAASRASGSDAGRAALPHTPCAESGAPRPVARRSVIAAGTAAAIDQACGGSAEHAASHTRKPRAQGRGVARGGCDPLLAPLPGQRSCSTTGT